MKKLFCFIVSVVFILSIISVAFCQEEVNFNKNLFKIISDYHELAPGMKRSDVLKYFTLEGAISHRTHATYIHKSSPYIKIDLVFKATDQKNKNDFENPNDIIIKISKLYLDYAVID